jgi:hypothetical protein
LDRLRLPSAAVSAPAAVRRDGRLLLLSGLAFASLCLASFALLRLLSRLGDDRW